MPNRNRSKKLMVLGAGPFQAPGICKAVELGHYVISVDYRPESIGDGFSHEYLNCSTVEREKLADLAEALCIDGICTFSSDVAVTSVGYICDRLALPGVSFAVAQSMSTKHRFREAQARAGLPSSRLLGSTLPGRSAELAARASFSGRVQARRFVGIAWRAAPAPRKSRMGWRRPSLLPRASPPQGSFAVEEFIGGPEFGGDAILLDGELVFAAITEKHLEVFRCHPPLFSVDARSRRSRPRSQGIGELL